MPGFPGDSWMVLKSSPSFPGVPPSRTSAKARKERGLLSQHVVGAAHP